MMALPEYRLTVEDRGEFLYAKLTGKDSFAASLSYWNEIADQVEKRGRKKLLVHENLTGDVSEAEMFELMSDLQASVLVGVKIAFFDENMSDEKINRFGQLVASNRGGQVQICDSYEAAEMWLLAKN